MLLKYSLHAPRRGPDDIKAFMTDFRAVFPDLNSGARLTDRQGDYVVGQWEGRHAHGARIQRFSDWWPSAATGRTMHFTGTTVLKVLMARSLRKWSR